MEVKNSRRTVAEAVDGLLDGIERRGLTLFCRIDHAAGAREVGLDLGAEEVVLFGNPRAGTQLMQEDPMVGYELPLRILVWQADGAARLGYRDPRELTGDFKITKVAPVLDRMAALLDELTSEAAG